MHPVLKHPQFVIGRRFSGWERVEGSCGFGVAPSGSIECGGGGGYCPQKKGWPNYG
jgi:hypothetical protein